MNLELTDAERAYLAGLLNEALGDLREEIRRTDDRHYRDALRSDEQLLLSIIGKAGAGAART